MPKPIGLNPAIMIFRPGHCEADWVEYGEFLCLRFSPFFESVMGNCGTFSGYYNATLHIDNDNIVIFARSCLPFLISQ